MIKHLFFLIGFLAFIFFISSCSQMRSKYYVGEKEKIPTGEVKKETIWQYEDDVYYVRVLDSLNVLASSLEWNGSVKEYRVKNYDVVFSKLKGYSFLNIKLGEDGLYTIFRMVMSEDGIIAFFIVNEERLKKDMEQGIIKATEKDSEFVMELNKNDLDNYVSENINELFKIKTPGIIKPLFSIEKK